jgi:tRNA nucleotidyltransferase/poly(A) polymerase
VGIQFGTVLVLLKGKHFEVTTFRAEGRYEDGRHPSAVTYSNSITEDLERRDLTINGLIYDTRCREIIDYTDGLRDIQRRIVRSIGSPYLRFDEDRLRMLRAVRFAARLDFALESETKEAICQLAPLIRSVSAERVQQELFKILQCPYPARGIALLDDTGLIELMLPSLGDIGLICQRLKLYESRSHRDLIIALCLLLADLNSSQVTEVTSALRLSNAHNDKLSICLSQQDYLHNFPNLPIHEQKRFLRQAEISDIIELGSILSHWQYPDADSVALAVQMLSTWPMTELRPLRLLTGDDLKKLRYPPGPHYKDILIALENMQLAGAITNRTQALEWLELNYAHLKIDQ